MKSRAGVRSEILGLLGQPAAVAAVNGEVVSLLDLRQGVLYRGEASSRNLRRVLRIPLRIQDLVSFILYQVPIIEHRVSTLEVLSTGGYLLSLEGAGGLREKLTFDDRQRLAEAHISDQGKEFFSLRYENFSDGEKPFPRQFQLKLPDQRVEARIEFSSLETNVELDEKLFRLEKPEGFQVRPLL